MLVISPSVNFVVFVYMAVSCFGVEITIQSIADRYILFRSYKFKRREYMVEGADMNYFIRKTRVPLNLAGSHLTPWNVKRGSEGITSQL